MLVVGDLTAVLDDDPLGRRPAAGPDILHLLHDAVPVDDLPEHDVLPVQPRRLGGADEELGPVGAGPGVGHGEHARSGVPQVKVLVGELGAVDGLAAGAVAAGEVASLAHEARDDAVERRPLVVQRLAGRAQALLARAEQPEVVGGAGHLVGEELHDHAPGLGLADQDVEEDLGVLRRHCCCDVLAGQIKDGSFLSFSCKEESDVRTAQNRKQNLKFFFRFVKKKEGKTKKKSNREMFVWIGVCTSSLHGLQGSTAGDHRARRMNILV